MNYLKDPVDDGYDPVDQEMLRWLCGLLSYIRGGNNDGGFRGYWGNKKFRDLLYHVVRDYGQDLSQPKVRNLWDYLVNICRDDGYRTIIGLYLIITNNQSLVKPEKVLDLSEFTLNDDKISTVLTRLRELNVRYIDCVFDFIVILSQEMDSATNGFQFDPAEALAKFYRHYHSTPKSISMFRDTVNGRTVYRVPELDE